jgi:MSHA biogenesis protein MshN
MTDSHITESHITDSHITESHVSDGPIANSQNAKKTVLDNSIIDSKLVEPIVTSDPEQALVSVLDAIPSELISELAEPVMQAQAATDSEAIIEKPLLTKAIPTQLATTHPAPTEPVLKDSDTKPTEEPQSVLANIPESTPQEPGEFSIAPSNGAIAELSSLREQARVALAEENQSGAIDALRAILINYPEDLQAPKQLASILFSQQRFSEATEVLENALQGLPADSSLRMMLSRIAFKTGDIQLAYETLAAHPYKRLADIELLSFRAALAERLQHYQHANEDYVLLVGREPRNARWWLGLGISQDKLAQSSAAIKSYQQAKDLNQLPTQVREFVQERIDILARQS